jgi:hypothetical protein
VKTDAKKAPAWLPATLVVLAVTITTAIQPTPMSAPPPTGGVRQLFDEVTRDEPKDREAAKDDWAHHAWSQQDAFGALELERVSRFSRNQNVTKQALFLLIDDGLRAHWPGPDGKPLITRTVPLKPRPMD